LSKPAVGKPVPKSQGEKSQLGKGVLNPETPPKGRGKIPPPCPKVPRGSQSQKAFLTPKPFPSHKKKKVREV